MAEFQSVGGVKEFADPSSTFVEVDERPIVLIHAASRFYALDDVCTHDGGPLSDGDVEFEASEHGASIACPRHGAKFSAATGAALTMPATKPTVAHEVRVEGDRVFVRLNDQ
jgi:3-phenylpropionate/trans-cinnamate dioxygenase ferredoxin subunit